MALSRLQYLEHILEAIEHAVVASPGVIEALLVGLSDFIENGPAVINRVATTQDNRQEAVDILFNRLWTSALGRQYHGHQMRHWLIEAKIAEEKTRDVPQRVEPVL